MRLILIGLLMGASLINTFETANCFASEQKTSQCQPSKTSFCAIKVIRVMDADTFLADLGENMHPLFREMSIRTLGIDTAESRPSRSAKGRECEKVKAGEAKEVVTKLLTQATAIHLHDCKFDKFGSRLDCRVQIIKGSEDVSLAEFLIQKKLGYPYNGEKKPRELIDWCDPSDPFKRLPASLRK